MTMETFSLSITWFLGAASGLAGPASDGGASPEPAAGRKHRPRILVLDDEPSIRAFLSKALRVAGLEPVVSDSGSDALARVRDSSFDGLLVDHRMAGMSGTEVFDAVVAVRPELADRFIFMSGDVLNPELRDFAAEHGVGLLAKPFDLDTVQRTVLEMLDRTISAGGTGS